MGKIELDREYFEKASWDVVYNAVIKYRKSSNRKELRKYSKAGLIKKLFRDK